MAVQSSSKKGKSALRTTVQQPLVPQAQAAATAAGKSDLERPMRQDSPLLETDSIDTDTDLEDEMPPPVYGDIYGEIRNEADGLGTTASVTDDGRVDIRINQLNRRLSQIFVPALRQQVESGQESRPPPAPYIPPSLGGGEGVPPAPRLNIVIQVVGSRGDVQPFVALGKVLKDTYGHRVRLATHPNFQDFVQEHGLEFFSIGGDPSRLMAFMVKNPSLVPGVRTLISGDISRRRRDVAEYIQGCWRSCYEAGDGMELRATYNGASEPVNTDPNAEPSARPFVADCIIANPPSFAHIHCAEKLGIPLHIMFTMPYSPTQAFPHPLANIKSSNADPQITNYLSYVMIEILSWQGLGDIINRFRAKCLGLDPVSLIWGPGMLQRLKIPHTYCWSAALIPKPKDWGPHISVSGFNFLDAATEYVPNPDLQVFLDAGPPPIYIGFGSIVLDDPEWMTDLVFEVARQTGQRVLLSKGWGGLGTERLHIPDNVFMLGDVPHDWLFKHVSCVVHHGGAGTTAAGIAAGRPTVVVPFFGDQAFWGAMVARAGAGPKPIPHKRLTAENLTDAINFCLKTDSLERARELASKIAVEQGNDTGAQSFHQILEVDRLRCNLAPSRPAAWRIKRTEVRLSAFAACTLVNATLLDFHDLKLFRSQEYYIDEGPLDPVSGGAAACYRAFSGMAMGLVEVPSETLKMLRIPSRSNRQQSQELLRTTMRESEPSLAGSSSAPTTSVEQNQTSLNIQGSRIHARSPPDNSGSSSTASNIGSSYISGTLEAQSSHKQMDPGRARGSSRNENFGKNQDMLRDTGVHTNKGIGRFIKAFVQTPMEVSVGMTKGFHNLPKLWGDDTVRPQQQVRDFKSGAMAAGKEFGFGWYDGVTGLVTQPWRGAQKEGASGFVKGIGKGFAGFATKPFAGFSGILSHTMKGVHKEVQKLFGSNVQNYIIASRIAQGYEEWLQSSDAEKQDVILRWQRIQKNLKQKQKRDELVQYVQEEQQEQNAEHTVALPNYGQLVESAQSARADTPTLDDENATLVISESQSIAELPAAENNQRIQPPARKTPPTDVVEDSNQGLAIQESVVEPHRPQQNGGDHQVEEEQLRQALAESEFEAQQHASEALEFKKQLELVMAQSVLQQ